jgi:hypothetical protein
MGVLKRSSVPRGMGCLAVQTFLVLTVRFSMSELISALVASKWVVESRL